jgi:hypothetical protein
MGKFSETHNLPRLDFEKIDDLNRPIMRREIESEIKKISIKKSPATNGFTGEFYQTLKGELISIL